MTHINTATIIIASLFGVCGFLISYFLRRSLGFFLIGALLYVVFKGLENLKFNPDWGSYQKILSLLHQLAGVLLSLIQNMISGASLMAILFFLAGGVLGLVFSWRK